MICQSCKKQEATIHYFESINGASKTLNLCEACAALRGIESLSVPFVTLEALLRRVPEGGHPAGHSVDARKACVACGMTYADFRRNQDKACPACLDTFLSAQELRNRLKKMEQGQGKLEGLKRLLARAVELEEYEEAARLRDQIRQAEEKSEAAI